VTTKQTLTVRGPARPLKGALGVPGDKSVGHRAVLFGAISDGQVRVRGLSGGEDNLRTVAAFEALGVPIRRVGEGALDIDGVGLDGLRAASGALDCGNSGTSIRLLSGLLAGQSFRSRLVGDEYLHARPMMRVADPLRQMGGHVEGQPGKKTGEIYPPLEVGGSGSRLHGIRFASKVASAQVKSAVLLAALYADGATTVSEPEQSRDHTERILRSLGVPIRVEGLSITVDPGGWNRRLPARDLEVPGDLSSAAFLLAAATLVEGSRVTIRGVGINPTRTGVLDALRAMGGRITVENAREQGGEPVADLTAEPSSLRGIEIAGALTVRAIDELPLLSVLAAHAEGETVIHDAAELRVKESDRIAATARLLSGFGAEVEERPDGLVIAGRGRFHPAVVDSHGDHRIAMAGAVFALTVAGETRIDDTANIATSFPTFTRSLTEIGADLR
jgi:3-phosphoshikimate 1-carboxyvinyltransferase